MPHIPERERILLPVSASLVRIVTRIIHIKCKIINRKIYIEISDNGKGIENVELAKQPLYTSKPDLERSGMGFTIMESFMDKLIVESILGVGTKIIMEKEIKELPKSENLTLEEALRG